MNDKEDDVEKEMWETAPGTTVKGVEMIKVWENTNKEQTKDMQQSCPTLGRL